MDKKTVETKKYLTVFACTTLGILSAIALFIYIIDPFFQYRTKDNSYILNPIYVNPGLAKNHDYNTAIIGSSMVQNYDLSELRQDSLVKPVKLASGAMTIFEMNIILSLIDTTKVNTFIVNLDMVQFNEWHILSKYPSYLHSGKFIDKLRYHFAYESVVRYGLVDLALIPYLAWKDGEELPIKLQHRTKIDDIGNFSLEATYNDEERIKNMYRSNQTVTSPNTFQMNHRMKLNIDKMLSYLEVEKYPNKEFIFVLPPYSALYWHITKREGYYHFLINNIKYICRRTAQYDNVKIQFFYNLDQITDLNRYSDVTHFDPQTSDYILNNLKNDRYTITTKNMNQLLNELDSTVTQFESENTDWIKLK